MVNGSIGSGGRRVVGRLGEPVVLPVTRLITLSLTASAWEGSESPYSQKVSAGGVDARSKVDILPPDAQSYETIFCGNNLCLVAENLGGELTVYAIGEKPLEDIVVKAAVTTVKGANGRIVGAALGGGGGKGGINGVDGKDGADGYSPTATVTQTANGAEIEITDKNGTTTATVTNGKDGENGKDGKDGINGINGINGVNGKDGISATHSWDGTTLTITSASGTSSANLKGERGEKGEKGETGAAGANGTNGKDGVSATHSWNGTVLSVTSASGTSSADLKGDPYTLTEADKAEIVQMVIESLGGNPIFGYVDENNNIIVSGNLADGSYSVKYEMEDGSTVDIGDLVLDTNVYYSITNNLTNCTNSNGATQVVEGGSYFATVTANSGYELKSVSATMGGSAVSVSGGVINIASVTGDIVITAVAEEKAVEPSYTNLAKNFEVGRFKSSGAIDATTTDATACTDYIPFTPGTVVRIKGFGALDDYNCVQYKSDKTQFNSALATNTVNDTYHTYSYDSATGIVTLTSVNANFGFIRFSGKLTGTTDDVIITVNEPIV
ncbi:MAG: hypothetical protein IKJ80_00565 [Clostridia bacterium]|nr:hypothetical protein [Clostridia bacterium]